MLVTSPDTGGATPATAQVGQPAGRRISPPRGPRPFWLGAIAVGLLAAVLSTAAWTWALLDLHFDATLFAPAIGLVVGLATGYGSAARPRAEVKVLAAMLTFGALGAGQYLGDRWGTERNFGHSEINKFEFIGLNRYRGPSGAWHLVADRFHESQYFVGRPILHHWDLWVWGGAGIVAMVASREPGRTRRRHRGDTATTNVPSGPTPHAFS